MDCSLPGSSVHRIFQTRVLEWVAISFSKGSSQPKDRTWVSCIAGWRFTIWATREVFQQYRNVENWHLISNNRMLVDFPWANLSFSKIISFDSWSFIYISIKMLFLLWNIAETSSGFCLLVYLFWCQNLLLVFNPIFL